MVASFTYFGLNIRWLLQHRSQMSGALRFNPTLHHTCLAFAWRKKYIFRLRLNPKWCSITPRQQSPPETETLCLTHSYLVPGALHWTKCRRASQWALTISFHSGYFVYPNIRLFLTTPEHARTHSCAHTRRAEHGLRGQILPSSSCGQTRCCSSCGQIVP